MLLIIQYLSFAFVKPEVKSAVAQGSGDTMMLFPEAKEDKLIVPSQVH